MASSALSVDFSGIHPVAAMANTTATTDDNMHKVFILNRKQLTEGVLKNLLHFLGNVGGDSVLVGENTDGFGQEIGF